MIDLKNVKHHPAIEEITDVLCIRTENNDRPFFRTELAYFIGKMAGTMRAEVITKDRGAIPVNVYSICLAPSGFGKGYSIGIIENEFLSGFRKRYMTETMEIITQETIDRIANERAVRKNTQEDDEAAKLRSEWTSCGAYPFTFDSGTAPAVKQMRTKLLISGSGAINLQVDEIGRNLADVKDLITVGLELYDKGLIKNKLTKNTSENVRTEEVEGYTPANMLLFGTPTTLLDGGPIETDFFESLQTGYSRRCIFAYGSKESRARLNMTPQQMYYQQINPQNQAIVNKWHALFEELADPSMHNFQITVPDDVAIQLIAYRVWCEQRSEEMPDHADIAKAEMDHRYFKALKIAGAYAFIDQTMDMTMEQLMQAILLVEESGKAFDKLLNRPKSYVRVAKFIADSPGSVTYADLTEKLPFFRSSQSYRNEQMTLAVAWAIKNHIIIKKKLEHGIEFFEGENLEPTNLEEIRISMSNQLATNFESFTVPWEYESIEELAKQDLNTSWCNHFFVSGKRSNATFLQGFNLVVFDVDSGTSIEMARQILDGYSYAIYTTKSHTPSEHRFRVMMPINYVMNMEADEYSEFISNILDWLPINADPASRSVSHKWRCNPDAEIYFNDGELLDALRFVPKTATNDSHVQKMNSLLSLDALERWFAERFQIGNRNHNMLRYALCLVDMGYEYDSIRDAVMNFNTMLPNSLPKDELENTVMRTVAKRLNV